MTTENIKEFYFRELDAKGEQDSRTATQVGILSVLGGILLFCYRNTPPISSLAFILFALLFSVSVVFYSLALVQVLRANIGDLLYERIPSMDILYNYFDNLKQYHARNPSARGSADDDFDDFLKRHMVSATARNTQTNLTRAARNYSALTRIAVAVVFALLSAVPVLISLKSNDRNPVTVDKVEVRKVVVDSQVGGRN